MLSGTALLVSGVLAFSTGRGLFEAIAIKVRVHRAEAQRDLDREWAIQTAAIAPEVARYVMLFPERVHPTGRDEFVRIDGLASLLKSKWPGFKVEQDSVLDPWGEPIQFGMDLNRDSLISHGRDAIGAGPPNDHTIIVGFYAASASDGQRWSNRVGSIERK